MGVIDFEYGDDMALEELLHSVDRPGDYFTRGRLFVPMPCVDVDGHGTLSFPVPEAQVRSLIAVAERAPIGKGTDTLVDRSVRDCFQIDAERVRVTGSVWPDTFSCILSAAASGLGCPVDRVDAHLYKLLVYEPGGFFSAHRDTEKAWGMVATLSISLPVAGQGGEVVVRHRDRETIIDMNVGEPSELAFVAFYADCEHEVRPVTTGHRLSLVYNLCVRPWDTDTHRRAPDHGDLADRIARHLISRRADNEADNETDRKLVWVLDHQYSEAGLSFATLKNVDAARAAVLVEAANRARHDIFAAVLHVTEHGDAVVRDDHMNSWNHDAYDVDDMQIGELFDSSCHLDNWAVPGGAWPQFGSLTLRGGEVLPYGALDHATPDEQWLHEATGNEGVSLERAYRFSALVLWPRSSTLSILAGTGVERAVGWLADEFDGTGQVADERIRRLALELTDRWRSRRPDGDKEARVRMLDLLSRFKEDGRCLEAFLHKVIVPRYTGPENDVLAAALNLAGAGEAGRFLSAFIDEQFPKRPGPAMALVVRIQAQQAESDDVAWEEVVLESVRSILGIVCREPDLRANSGAVTNQANSGHGASPVVPLVMKPDVGKLRKLNTQAVRDLFILARRAGLTDEAAAAADALVALPDVAVPERTLPEAIGKLHKETGMASSVPLATLWCRAAQRLLERSRTPPAEPTHWKMDVHLDCNCDVCATLVTFCHDPKARVVRLPLRKDLRAHLHQAIERQKLDIDHETERRGKPYTLVCTKNRAGFRRRLREYADDLSNMRQLIQVAPAGNAMAGCESRLAELHEAVAHHQTTVSR